MSDLSKLLAWSVENSAPGQQNDAPKRTELDPALLAQLFGQNVKDEATMMKEAMAAVEDNDLSVADKEIAFENFLQLMENLDNANNIENLKLWPSLLAQLSSPEKKMRFAAAWCCGTAVQNNPKSQADLLKHDGMPKLVDMALNDPDESVRKKSIYALSSQIRNNDPGLLVATKLLPKDITLGKNLKAQDMEGIDEMLARLRERSAKAAGQ